MLTLRAWRLAKELSVDKVSDILGIHPNTYRHWEKQPGVIPISKAYQLADLFGIKVDDIIFLMPSDSTEMSSEGDEDA